MAMLEVKGLIKSFGEKRAVDNVSFSASEGSIFGLVGRNGAGKTTTIRMLMDIYWPDAGEILFRGAKRGADFVRESAYLPEERGLYKDMKVVDNLMFLAEIRDVDRRTATERVRAYLERFELTANAHTVIEQLSKGNQQKVQIIGILLHDPSFLVLDEPFSGLDPVNVELLKNLIIELKNQGKLIILCTHQMDIAEKLCDHVALVHQGKLMLNASMADIKREYSQAKVTFEAAGDLGFLRSLPYVQAVQQFGARTTVQLRGDADIQTLLRSLVSHNVEIRKFDANDMSLHDIFLQKTGGQVSLTTVDAHPETASEMVA